MSSFQMSPGGMAVMCAPGGVVYNDLARRGRNVESAAKQLCPVDNGPLRASIQSEVQGSGPDDLAAIIGSPLHYARYRHDGTGVYGPRGAPIVPVNRSVLRWPTRGITSSRQSRIPGRGRVVTKSQTPTGYQFAMSVQGTPGVPYLLDALPAAAN